MTPSRVAAPLGMAALVLLLFHRALFTDDIFFQRDILTFWLPRVETFVRVVGQGAWPLWDPFEAFGAPLLADPGAQVVYPFTWLNLLLPPAASFKALVVFHCWLAGTGLYRLARAWGWERGPALVSGATWMLSGPFLSLVSMDAHICGAAWMPWVLAALEHVLQVRTPSAALVLAAAAAVQVFTGSGDMVVITALVGAGRGLAHVVRARSWPALRPLLAPAAISVLASSALAAVQWMPALELVRRRPRGSLGRDASLYWSMHPWSLAETFVPQAFADLPLADAWRAALYEGREPFLPSVYLGLPALALVLGGVLAGGRRARLLVVALAFFVGAALGRHTMMLPLLLEARPFAMLRYPVKYMVPAALCWALLAGLGVSAWLAPWSALARRRGRLLATGMLALTVVVGTAAWLATDDRRLMLLVNARDQWLPPALAPLRWKLAVATALAGAAALLLFVRARQTPAPPWLTVAMAALVLGDLLVTGRAVNSLGPAALIANRPPLLAHLDADSRLSRIYVETPPSQWLNRSLVRGPRGWQHEWSLALGVQEILMPPVGARWGLPGSYDGDVLGLADPWMARLSALLPDWRGTPQGLRLLRLGNVGHAVYVRPGAMGALVPVTQQDSVFTSPVVLARVPEPLPAAYTVGRCRIGSSEEALASLVSPEFDPRDHLVADECPLPTATSTVRGTVRRVVRRPDRWVADVDLEQAGYLVLVEGYDPGWRASVDGRPAPVLRANLLFQAIPVAAGSHVVECAYRPAVVGLGALLSVIAWPVAAAMTWARRRPKRGR